MVYKTEAVVLRNRDLGEADKIVTLYTKTNGKISAVARGSRRIRNRLLSPTQLFTHAQYMLFPGKGMDTVSQAETIHSFQSLRDDLERMAAAMYVVELVDVLIEEGEPNPQVFALLLDTLLEGSTGNFPLVLRAFELRIMKLLGYRPQLDNCIGCGHPIAGSVFFSSEGGVVCAECQGNYASSPVSPGTLQLAKKLMNWEWMRLSILRPSPTSLAQIEALMRSYIDFRLERPLKSLHFLKSLPDSG